ncbi:sensor histidine kinase [Cryptosporangium arvum]|uniref:histidine kinase n=1 Tax=Cryptosporangium arvum DSM 44712 TaxID=927661 RepID=A0A010YYD6_9ACTN|nr:sensor histidine kinase [Cryptosporangium arvum]EXG80223.1 signal transduction histidine kinase [Cryptosporangium arvum DSM 44712]
MKSRSRSVLAKLITLLALPFVSLVVLWAIAASATLGQGIDLLKINDEVSDVVDPLQELGRELRAERLESVIAVAAPERNAEALREQRARTDRALNRFRDRAVDGANTDAVRSRVTTFLDALDDLEDRRSAIDRRTLSRLAVVDYFTGALDLTLPIVTTIPHLPVSDFALRANATLELASAIETQSEEMAVLAGATAGGRFEADEYTRAVQLIGAQRHFYTDVLPQLEPVDQQAYRDVTGGSAARLITAAEDSVVRSGAGDAPPPIDADDWIDNSRALSGQMVDYSLEVSDRLFDDFIPTAAWVLIRIAVGGVLGLVAVIVSIVVALRIGRSLVRELVGVQRSAQSLATYELPAVVRRLRSGESVDVDAEVQPMTGFTIKEIEGVASAMDAARSTAVEVAIEEAQLRRGVREVFLNLARRSQALIHRQLTLLDAMERREKDPDELEDLFTLDHLATRMRRHAEDLIVLSGSTPGRGWRNPVPLIDVMRGAIAEVEDYARVRVVGSPRASLAGRGVSDVIHLLAELIENATSFSPPHTTVHVTGELVPAGFAIEIEDRGLGMPPEQLEAVNQRLAEPPEFDLLQSERLGLFVVGQLARRHDIRVVLRGSPFGGTTAIVLLPGAMIVAPEGAIPTQRREPMRAEALAAEAVELPVGPPVLTVAAEPGGAHRAPEEAVNGNAPVEPPPVFDPSVWSGGTDWSVLSDDTVLRPADELRAPAGSGPSAFAPSAFAPSDFTQADFTPAGPDPVEPARAEPAPVDAAPVDAAPVDAAPAEAGAGGLPPLTRRDPGVGWEHLTAQGPLPRRERLRPSAPDAPPARTESVEPDADDLGPDQADQRPRGVARAPIASRARPADEPADTSDPPSPEPTDPEPAVTTPGGLPRRVRQASLAAPLRAGSGIPPAPVEPTTMRSPEEIRAVMGSYQRGSVRGRSDAERTIAPESDPAGPAAQDSASEPDGVPAGQGSNTGALEGER